MISKNHIHWNSISFYINIIFFNYNLLIISINRDIRWNSTHDLLFNYLNLYPIINITLDIFKKLEKKENLRLTPSEIVYVSNIYDILHIFLKSSIHLQVSNYSIIKYVFSHVFNVRKKLKNKYEDSNIVSFFFFLFFFLFFLLLLSLLIKNIKIQYCEMHIIEIFKNSTNDFQNSIFIDDKKPIKMRFLDWWWTLDSNINDLKISILIN